MTYHLFLTFDVLHLLENTVDLTLRNTYGNLHLPVSKTKKGTKKGRVPSMPLCHERKPKLSLGKKKLGSDFTYKLLWAKVSSYTATNLRVWSLIRRGRQVGVGGLHILQRAGWQGQLVRWLEHDTRLFCSYINCEYFKPYMASNIWCSILRPVLSKHKYITYQSYPFIARPSVLFWASH